MSVLAGRIAVVVPTYWTRAGGMPLPGDAVYDHPTPLDEEGTLERLLQSLTTLDTSRFVVVIVVAVTCPQVADDASRKVRAIAMNVPGLSCLIVDQGLIDTIGQSLLEAKDSPLIGVEEYSLVRNLQLLVPLALGSPTIVAVDDDEVVLDPQFLERAVQGLGETVADHKVDGIGGYYLQNREGQILLTVPPEVAHSPNIFDRKAVIMNEATELLEASPGSLVPTPFCFGGNMVFSRELAADICFDPWCTRGEDIDYLINARLAGRWFFMNKELTILHLPPQGGSYSDVAYHKVVQDVLRFVYEREKLQAWEDLGAAKRLSVEDLDPYPGAFLRDDLDGYAREVLERVLAATNEAQQKALGLNGSADEFLAEARRRALLGVSEYRHHQDAWRRLTASAASNDGLRAALESAIFETAA